MTYLIITLLLYTLKLTLFSTACSLMQVAGKTIHCVGYGKMFGQPGSNGDGAI